VITIDEGPFSAFRNMRARINTSTWVGRGLRCEHCLSFWLGLLAALFVWHFGAIVDWELPLWWLGLSGSAILVDYVAKR